MTARAWPLWLLPLPLLALSACDAEPDTTQRDAGEHESGLRDGLTEPDAETWFVPRPPPSYAPTFSAVFDEVFEHNLCTSEFCHGLGGATLNFSTKRAGYDSLVDRPATGAKCKDRGLVLVVPGDPEASLLFLKVSTDTPPCGARMPHFPGFVLNDREIAQIREWIALGALDD